MKIGIVGNGVVGHATARTYMENHEVRIWDKVPTKTTHSLHETNGSDIVFICLPETELDTFFQGCTHSTAFLETNFVLRSTVPIGTTRRLWCEYKLSNIVHSPEFLTSRCAVTDAQCPSRNIIGTRTGYGNPCGSVLKELYLSRFPGVQLLWMSSDQSEAVKLITNAFFAVKIAFFNEVNLLCKTLAVTGGWPLVLDGILSDGRIAHSHTQVPGPDGHYGFGGGCLPKDLEMVVQHLLDEHLPCHVTTAAQLRNKYDRSRGK